MAYTAAIGRANDRVQRMEVERQRLGGAHHGEHTAVAVVVGGTHDINHAGPEAVLETLEFTRRKRVAGERSQRLGAEELEPRVRKVIVEMGQILSRRQIMDGGDGARRMI